MMSYTVSWLIENRVIQVKNEGILTLEDLRAEDREVQAFLESGTAPIHIISDNTQLDRIPQGISAMKETLEGLRHPNIAWVVNIQSSNHIIRYLATVIARIMGVHFTQVSTMDEAIAFICKHDATVDWDELGKCA